VYDELLRKTVVWPTIGNHDAYAGGFGFPHFPYLDIFSLPTNGEAGGVPSGTERYYSYNYGNIHFVCLDSMTVDRSSTGPMCAWLRADLEANTSDWLIAYWHHPPYSKGSHHSDFEIELIEMRENVVPILESYGVDLVMAGHSHSYERSFLLNGHYGLSTSLQPAMKLNGGSGRENDSGAYSKADTGPGPNQGAVYVVAGSSGWVTPDFGLDHPAMFISLRHLGSMVLDIDGHRMDAKFLREDGSVADYFTIIKGAPVEEFRITAYEKAGGQLTFWWNTVPGKSYRLDRATHLSPPIWVPATEPARADAGRMSTSIPLAGEPPTAFYRVFCYDD
jgi:hypothetical protein